MFSMRWDERERKKKHTSVVKYCASNEKLQLIMGDLNEAEGGGIRGVEIKC